MKYSLRILLYLIIALLIVTSLSACVKMNDPEGTQDYKNDIVGVLQKSEIIGQSFVSRRPRLNGITFWLTATAEQDAKQGNGHLLFNLYHSPKDQKSIYTTSIAISPAWDMSPIEFPIPIQNGTPGQAYYVTLETTNTPIKVHGRTEDIYISGNTSINGVEISNDLAFRMSYDYDIHSFFDDLRIWASNGIYLMPLLVTIFFPGWAILELSGLRRNYSASIQSALSLGLSISFIPLLFLWCTIFNITLSRSIILWILCFLAVAIILRLIIRRYRRNKPSGKVNLFSINVHNFIHPREIITTIILASIIIGAFLLRLSMVRDLATPPWVDSVHHAMITRLIMQNGSLPSTYSPYMDFNIYNYHTGYHSGLAVFTWLSGLDLPDSMLIYGQALNALAVLSVYLFTRYLTGNAWAGLLAATITGFLTPMPAYYTSWGRYTQLAGILILPTATVFLAPITKHFRINEIDNHHNYRLILLGSITISGLFLVHYRVVAFVVFLLIANFLTSLPGQRKNLFKYVSRITVQYFLCVTVSFCLVAPWLFPAFSYVFIPKLNPVSVTDVKLFGDFSWRFLTAALGKQALIMSGLGLVVAIIAVPRIAFMIILWLLQLLFFSNLDALKLPGGGFITGTSVVIMLFIPISMLGGFFLSKLISSWEKVLTWYLLLFGRITLFSIVGVTLIYSAFVGARNLLPIINPITILTRQADRNGLDWISENISPQSTFLINPFPWGFGLYAGNDGGYWISPITGAISVPPPALYGLGNLKYITKINDICQVTIDPNTNPVEIWDLMDLYGIEYIYIGVRGGELSPLALQQSELFTRIYNRDGVHIFQAVDDP